MVECPVPGYYGNSVTTICEPCHESCASCFGADYDQCDTCKTETHFHMGAEPKCCSNECAPEAGCYGPTNKECKKCKDGSYLSIYNCVF